jgi:hypothetical protein
MGGLTWDTSGDDDHVCSGEGLLHPIVCWEVSVDLRHGGDVRQVSRHTWGVDDIVEGEVVYERAGLEEEGEWLLQWIGDVSIGLWYGAKASMALQLIVEPVYGELNLLGQCHQMHLQRLYLFIRFARSDGDV